MRRTLNTAPPAGVKVQFLCGTSSGLVSHISCFGKALDERAPFSRESVLGSLVFFCGGVMDCMVDGHEMDGCVRAFGEATLGKPFVTVHPFGEQCFQSGWGAWQMPISHS